MSNSPSIHESLLTLSRQLMHCQLQIYRAEWDLEVDETADKAAALRHMVKQQLTFHALCLQPELAQLPADTGDTRIDELRRLHAQAKGIDLSLIETAAGAALRSLQSWHAAVAANDYSLVREPHENVIILQRRMARIKADNLSALYGRAVTPYEALIDNYDPGRTLEFIKTTFDKVGQTCRTILDRKGVPTAPPLFAHPVDTGKQAAFCLHVMTAMGYDAVPPRGVLGVSAHPLCRRVGPREVWLTNRYSPNNFSHALMNIIHEGGHGRYYQNLPEVLADDWMGGVAGETINEGMALFAEQVIGRSREFCSWLAPQFEAQLGQAVTASTLHDHLTAVSRDDMVRAEAREVMYPLHLRLRIAVEEALINDGLKTADLPAFWNQQSKDLMGFTPPDDVTGCLQDIHPFVGYIGYFPCYGLGFMVAAQIGAALKAAVPDVAAHWAKGDMTSTNHWLQAHIYKHGRMLPADKLIEVATGKPLGPDALIAHLQERYG
ncbi:MAG: hypothetical protein AB7G06_02210 [Bdellovibrionales bacterium]